MENQEQIQENQEQVAVEEIAANANEQVEEIAANANEQVEETAANANEQNYLVSIDEYLAAGVHIGTQQKTKDMMRFVYRVRTDGLYVLDIQSTDERIIAAAELLSKYDINRILIVSSRQYGQYPARMFAKTTGCRPALGRFIPGMLTNPRMDRYFEPEIVIVTDPAGDAQVIREACGINIPVIALADSNNLTKNVDLVIPTNNKGRKALSLVYWLLAKELCKANGTPFNYELSDFEIPL